MKLTTKQMLMIGSLLVLISQGENIRKGIEKEGVRKDARTIKQERLRDDKDKVKELDELSKVALSRADSCIDIFNINTNTNVELSPSTQVLDSAKSGPLREGVIVCSGNDTGVVTKDGALSNIARVNKTDEPLFYKIRGQKK